MDCACIAVITQPVIHTYYTYTTILVVTKAKKIKIDIRNCMSSAPNDQKYGISYELSLAISCQIQNTTTVPLQYRIFFFLQNYCCMVRRSEETLNGAPVFVRTSSTDDPSYTSSSVSPSNGSTENTMRWKLLVTYNKQYVWYVCMYV